MIFHDRFALFAFLRLKRLLFKALNFQRDYIRKRIEPPFSAFVTTVGGGFDVAVGAAHGAAVDFANGFAGGVADPDLEVEVVVLS